MGKPTTTPSWATSGDKILPNSGKLASGFKTGGERPLSQFLNWLFYWITQWISFWAGQGRVFSATNGFTSSGADWTYSTGSMAASTNSSLLLVRCPMKVGDVISKSEFRTKPNGAGSSVQVVLLVYRDDVLVANSSTITVTTSIWTTTEILDPLTGYELVEGDNVFAEFLTSGGGTAERRAGGVTLYV